MEKRAMVGGGQAPTLSQLLREAKADSEEKGEGAKVTNEQILLSYSRLFDEYKGKSTISCCLKYSDAVTMLVHTLLYM